MKNNWRKVKLDNVCELIAGFAFKSKDFGAYPDKVVKITNIEPPFVNMTNLVGVDLSKYNRNNLAKFIVKRGDYVLAMTGATIGKLGRISNDDIAYINQRVLKFKPNDGVDKDFLFFILSESNFSQYILNHIDSESAQANISAKTIGQYEFELPPLDAQKRISAVLVSLDNKIELNGKINQNLETQAQAIFKSWFVDFEPFGGKMPADWKAYKLGEFLPVITGKKNANVSSSKGKYPFFSCAQDTAWTDEFSFDANAILVAGNGDFNVKFYSGKFEAYQRTYVLIPHNPTFTNWLYYVVKYNLERITSGARGSVIKFITKGNLEDFSFFAPRNLDKLTPIDFFNSTNNKIAENKLEILKLAQLRDTLLPKLMSGEIDVSDVAV